MSQTCFVHLPLDRLHASGLLDDVIDELGRLLIPHLSLTDPGLGEQAQQVGVDVVGIPADVGDMSEEEETDGDDAIRFQESCKTTRLWSTVRFDNCVCIAVIFEIWRHECKMAER